MATENTPAKAATKNDKDTPTIEVKEETSTETKSAPSKEAPKPAATKEAAKATVAKEEPKPAVDKEAAKPAVAKEEPKPAPAPVAAKEEPKPAPAPVAAKEGPRPAPSPVAAKEEPKPAPAAAKEAPKPAAAQEAPKPAGPKPPPAVDTVSRVGRADAIVRRNVLWALGAGVVPFPIFDAVAITGVQLKMLAELSELYKVSFSESIAKKLLGSLISSLGGVALGTVVGASLVKMIPSVGTALGIVSVPLIGGAATHATGKVFVMHFEAGGTLLDFDPHKMRSYYKQEFEKAKQSVADLKNEQSKGNKTN